MNVAEFEDFIDRLGEDMSQWPESQRLAAAQLLESSDEARALLEQATILRDALSSPPIRAPAGLADRIVSAAMRQTAASGPAEREEAEALVDNSGRP